MRAIAIRDRAHAFNRGADIVLCTRLAGDQEVRRPIGLPEDETRRFEGCENKMRLPQGRLRLKEADNLRSTFTLFFIAVKRWQESADLQAELLGQPRARDKFVRLTFFGQTAGDAIHPGGEVLGWHADENRVSILAQHDRADAARYNLTDSGNPADAGHRLM